MQPTAYSLRPFHLCNIAVMDSNYQDISVKLAPLLDALSHPARLQILLHLAKYKGCPAWNISNQLPISKSTVSQHMAKLKEVGLIECNADGTSQQYRLSDDAFALLKTYFLDFFSEIEASKDNRVECCPKNGCC